MGKASESGLTSPTANVWNGIVRPVEGRGIGRIPSTLKKTIQTMNHSRTTKIFSITGRMLLGVLRDFSASTPGADIVDIAIAFAIITGFDENLPTTATKIAAFAGLPRATVTRRIKALVARGLVIYGPDGKSILPSAHRVNGEAAKVRAARFARHIKQAADELSKLDTFAT